MSNQRKIILIIIATFIALFIIAIIIFIAINKTNQDNTKIKETALIETYIDPGSGETVYTTPNKLPEITNSNSITFLGFTKLIDLGMTKNQLDVLKRHFSDYSLNQTKPLGEISITKSSLSQTINKNSGQVTLNFSIVVDRVSNLKASAVYSGIDDMILKIYKPDNSLLFDSSI